MDDRLGRRLDHSPSAGADNPADAAAISVDAASSRIFLVPSEMGTDHRETSY